MREVAYRAEAVQIARGLKPIAQRGAVVIADGEVVLFGTKGDLIASAPLQTVTAKPTWYTLGNGCKVQVGDAKYFLAFNQKGLTNADRVLNGRKGTKEFIKALKAAQGPRRPY